MPRDHIATLTGASNDGNQTPVTGTQVGSKRGLDVNVVGGEINADPDTTTSGAPLGVTVSTTAVLLAASNTDRKSIIITNNGTGTLYIGHDNTVSSSGAAMGLLVQSKCSYTDSGFGLYTGDLWGIYSAASASENVSVSERE